MWKSFFLYLLSFALVAFGQPAWCWGCGLLAACVGYALFWVALNTLSSHKQRFWVATLWFSLVQAIQLSWFISHPYLYIWIIYFSLCFGMGVQFGLLSLFVRPSYMERIWKILALAGFWTVMEWSRLWVLSGFSWNPVGLALSGSLYPLQLASIAGIYGLSFWVIFVNLLAFRAWYARPRVAPQVFWLLAAALPYAFGWAHVSYHDSRIQKMAPKQLSALLVQTAFPIEECLDCPPTDLVAYVEGEWRQILTLLKLHHKEKVDLIVLPEFVVPFGTWTPVWPWERIRTLLIDVWGLESLAYLPPLEAPWAGFHKGQWYVSNAFFLQTLSNLFSADIVAGLEDADAKEGRVEYYTTGRMFQPWHYEGDSRYLKRILVPMGEYIPFEFCRSLAAKYGIGGSFIPGKEAKVFQGKKGGYGVSICYEETYGHLMRENKQLGAEVLLNLTSDVWYPNSRLPQQHLDHARLRALEGGLPLLRSCNTGITCALDGLGRTVATLGPEEWKQAALRVSVPLYHYPTLYTSTGDTAIIGFSSFLSLVLFLRRKSKMP